ncbi:NikB-like protein [Salmonella enterica subsp. enterica]|uniref:NikB-like protein n=1 Tax=Salmonella enterica I TaxID=59201 RepID=A0A379VZC7_SALET|nr:NikB-like protein [Salmonella enterica subsp. enterica]
MTGTGSAVNVTQCCAGSDVKPELRPVLTCVPAIWHGVNNGVNQICVMGNVVGKFIRHAVLRKSHIRAQYDDPALRKLHYHIAEVQRMQALIRLKEDIRDERQKLIADGKWYPPSYRQWVEIQAAQGDRAAVSQLRGWDYRDRRKDRSRTTTTDRCVVLCETGRNAGIR